MRQNVSQENLSIEFWDFIFLVLPGAEKYSQCHLGAAVVSSYSLILANSPLEDYGMFKVTPGTPGTSIVPIEMVVITQGDNDCNGWAMHYANWGWTSTVAKSHFYQLKYKSFNQTNI